MKRRVMEHRGCRRCTEHHRTTRYCLWYSRRWRYILLLLLVNVIHALLHYQFSLRNVLVHRSMSHFIEFFFYVFIVWLILVPQILQIVKESFDLLKSLDNVWKQVLLGVFKCFLFQLLDLILVLVY